MQWLLALRRWRRVLLGLVWLLATLALVALAHWEGRRQHQNRMETFGGDLQNLAQVSATILTQRLQQLDDVLLVLRAACLSDPQSLESTIALLRKGPLADRSLQVVRVGRDGLLAYADTPGAKPGMFLGDRSYFKFFQDGAPDQFLIDEPVVGRVTQRLSVPLVRPIFDAQGRFDGVLALSVTQASLTEFGARLEFSPDTVVSLFNVDGALVSRSRELEKLKGARLTPEQLAPLLNGPYGLFDHVSPLDGVARSVAFHRLGVLPLVVLVAAEPRSLRLQAERELRVLLFAAAVACGVLGALLWLIARLLRRRRQAALQGRMAKAIFENVGQPVVVTDADARIVMMNPAAAAVTGFSVQEALGQRPSLWRSNRHDAAFYENMWRTLLDTGQWVGDIWNRNKAGVAFPVLLSVTAVRDPSSLATRYVGIYSDITERKRSEEEMWRRANFDVLTGLPNRMLLHERLDRALARATRDASCLALLFIDLDGFKPVNDAFGHHAGDAVLHGVAERLQSQIRESDTAARLGGDEFVVLLQTVGSADDVRQVGLAVLAAVQEPLQWQGQAITVSCSIGMALFPQHATDREGLLARADAAMYRAKAAGKGCVAL